jgi:hypothetical protein
LLASPGGNAQSAPHALALKMIPSHFLHRDADSISCPYHQRKWVFSHSVNATVWILLLFPLRCRRQATHTHTLSLFHLEQAWRLPLDEAKLAEPSSSCLIHQRHPASLPCSQCAASSGEQRCHAPSPTFELSSSSSPTPLFIETPPKLSPTTVLPFLAGMLLMMMSFAPSRRHAYPLSPH